MLNRQRGRRTRGIAAAAAGGRTRIDFMAMTSSRDETPFRELVALMVRRRAGMFLLVSLLAWVGVCWWAITSLGTGGLARLVSDPIGVFAGLLKKYQLPMVDGGPADGLQLGNVPFGRVVSSLVHVELPLLLVFLGLGFAAGWALTVLREAVRARRLRRPGVAQ